MSYTNGSNLKEKWNRLIEEQGSIRIRNAAEALGVSEAELLATDCGNGVVRLRPDFQDILKEVSTLGKVMALSRNNEVVHERKGFYLDARLDNPHVGLFVGEDIDLRIFFAHWASAFAVQTPFKDTFRYSLQFFAADGEAVHKIYLEKQSDFDAYEALTEKFRSEDQSTEQSVSPIEDKTEYASDEEVDKEAFRKAWLGLKDTHHFFGLLKKHKLDRLQALRLAPEGGYAVELPANAFEDAIRAAAETETEIMVFVGNRGIIQIHTGPVKKLLMHGEWFNVMDPDFNLHVKSPEIKSCWLVRKPTEDGVVTAIECFNGKGKQIMQLFGKRKPGIPELEAWRGITADLEKSVLTQQ